MLLFPLVAVLFAGVSLACCELSQTALPRTSTQAEIVMKIEHKLAKAADHGGAKNAESQFAMKKALEWLARETGVLRSMFGRNASLVAALKTLTAIKTAPKEQKCSIDGPSLKVLELLSTVPDDGAPVIFKMVDFHAKENALDCQKVYLEMFNNVYPEMGPFRSVVESNSEPFIKAQLDRAAASEDGSRLAPNEQLSLYNTFVLDFKPLAPESESAIIEKIIDPEDAGFSSELAMYEALTDKLVGPCFYYIHDLADIFIPAMHDALLLGGPEHAYLDGASTRDFYLAWARYAVCQGLIEDYLQRPKPAAPSQQQQSSSEASEEIQPEFGSKLGQIAAEVVASEH